MERILVTGSNGLVGSALQKVAKQFPNYEFFFLTRKDGDLTKEDCVSRLYQQIKPNFVIHTAAKVGGIGANLSKPADFFYENILMNSFMIHYGFLHNVQKLIAFTSVCSFPDKVPILREDLQQEGAPFRGNFAYGYAKRMVDIQIQAYRIQHGTKFCSVIPGNLYGPGDNFSLEDGHVIPSLIHKCYLAKNHNTPLVLWGDGSSLREFIFSEDISKLTMSILQSGVCFDRIIVSNNVEISIKELVNKICNLMEYKGEIIWDTTKSNGQHRRPSDTSLLKSVVPNFNFTSIDDGLEISIKWFNENYQKSARL